MTISYLYDNKRHLICYPYSVENLHSMAKDLGIGRQWFHRGKYPHYDIPKRKTKEIALKCNLVSARTILKIIKNFHSINLEMTFNK